MAEPSLYDKVYGLLAGCALGDAFGIRVEMMHYLDIAEQYGRVDHFNPLPPRKPSRQPPGEQWQPFGVQVQNVRGFHPLGRWSRETGAYTDDTRYRLMICQAILRKGGFIDGSDLAAEWLNYRLKAEGAEDYLPTISWEGPEREYARLIASLENLAWMVNSQRFTVKSWDAPLGLLYPGRPEEAARVGYSMASAVAAALAPGATLDGMIDAVLKNAGSLGSQAVEFSGRLQRLLDIAAHCKDVFDLYEPFYKHFLVAFPPWEAVFPLEMVPCAIAICYIAKTDAKQAIIGGANVGRDADTIAAIAGELMGVLYGAQAFPVDWLEQVLRCNPAPDLPQMARELCAVMAKMAGRSQQASAQLLTLSGPA
jgi:hypothetical protein